MSATPQLPKTSFTEAEAQERLSEILRLVETEGAQRITTEEFVITLKASPLVVRTEADPEGLTLGQWLVKYMPRGTNLEIPREPRRCDCEKRFLDDEDNE